MFPFFTVQLHHVGCYAHKPSSPAIPSLEGKDILLDGEPKTREDAEQKCARVALKNGYGYFAIQDGGSCLSSLTAQETYSKYGLSAECQNGKGSAMASDVYEVVMFSKYMAYFMLPFLDPLLHLRYFFPFVTSLLLQILFTLHSLVNLFIRYVILSFFVSPFYSFLLFFHTSIRLFLFSSLFSIIPLSCCPFIFSSFVSQSLRAWIF